MKQCETGVLRECLTCLSHHGFDVVPPRSRWLFPWREGTTGIIWRNAVGAGWHVNRGTGRLGQYPVYYGLPGSPDLFGFLSGGARVIGVECKTARGSLSDNQKTFQDWVTKAGGIFIVARSYEECDKALNFYEL
jgi:VRR-NUC domain